MKINFEFFNRLLKIQFNPDIDYLELKKALDNETGWSEGNTRKFLQSITHPKIENIIQFLKSPTVTQQVLEHFYTRYEKEILAQWNLNKHEMYLRTDTNAYFCKDLPGHKSSLHLDVSRVIFTGVIYFTSEDNRQLSTYFYTDDKKSNEFRVDTSYGSGWIQFNTKDAWHEGGNNTESITRYIIIFEIMPYLSANPKRLF